MYSPLLNDRQPKIPVGAISEKQIEVRRSHRTHMLCWKARQALKPGAVGQNDHGLSQHLRAGRDAHRLLQLRLCSSAFKYHSLQAQPMGHGAVEPEERDIVSQDEGDGGSQPAADRRAGPLHAALATDGAVPAPPTHAGFATFEDDRGRGMGGSATIVNEAVKTIVQVWNTLHSSPSRTGTPSFYWLPGCTLHSIARIRQPILPHFTLCQSRAGAARAPPAIHHCGLGSEGPYPV